LIKPDADGLAWEAPEEVVLARSDLEVLAETLVLVDLVVQASQVQVVVFLVPMAEQPIV
jgi:hypothetical protein